MRASDQNYAIAKLLQCGHPKTCVSSVIRMTSLVERCSCCGSVRYSDIGSGQIGKWERPLYVQCLADARKRK
jgi:hypothetical protein